MAFSPDGKTILTGRKDKTARLWDAATGLPIGKPMEHPDNVDSVAFSPDGKRFAPGALTGRRGYGTPRPGGPSASRWSTMARAGILGKPTFRSAPTARLSSSKRDNKVRLGNAKTGLPIGKPMEHQARVERLR